MGILDTYPRTLDQNLKYAASADRLEGQIVHQIYSKAGIFAGSAVKRSQVLTPGVGTQEVTVYRLIEELTGQTVQFTSSATPTAAAVVTGLKAAIVANPILNGLVDLSGTSTLIITAKQPGKGYTQFSFKDNGSTPTNKVANTSTTLGSNGSPLAFGRILQMDPATGLITPLSAAISGSNIFAGIMPRSFYDVQDLMEVDPLSAITQFLEGTIYLKTLTDINPGSTVYGSTAADSDQGRIRADNTNATDVSKFIIVEEVATAGSLVKCSIVRNK